jgi:hypothetical protein
VLQMFNAIASDLRSLYGPALSAPDADLYNSGSTFAFSMFSDDAGTVPALTENTDGCGAIEKVGALPLEGKVANED